MPTTSTNFALPKPLGNETVSRENYNLLIDAIDAALAVVQGSAVPSGAVEAFARVTAPSGWLECNGAAVDRTTYATLFAAITSTNTVTFQSQAGSLRCNWSVPGMASTNILDLMPVTFWKANGGTLPTGIVAGTEYLLQFTGTYCFVLQSDGVTAVSYTNSGSGELHARAYPFGIGDGSTTFNVPELRSEFIRGWPHGRSGAGDLAARMFGSWRPATLTPVDTTMNSENVDAMGIGPSGAILQGDTYVATDYPSAQYNRVNGDSGQGTIDDLADVPANATAVHPRNVALMFCIKA